METPAEYKLTKSDKSIEKIALVEAYVKSFGNITTACKAVGLSRETYYSWYNNDIGFKNAIDNSGADEYFLDFLESKLAERINKSSDACLIFALKTKGKKRGYIERQEVEHTTNIPILTVNPIKNANSDNNSSE